MQKDFSEIYQKICSKSKDELDSIKNKNLKNTAMLVIVSAVIMLLLVIFKASVETKLTVLFILLCTLIIFLIINRNTYRSLYKEKVISILIKEYNNSFEFQSVSTLSEREYRQSGFDNTFNILKSEDEITGILEDNSRLKMAQVSTFEERVVTDSDGKTHVERTETFRGLYGYVRLSKFVANNINISSNSFFRKYDSKRIEIDSAEFEKKYDLYAADKLNAMEIFTSDLIEKFINNVHPFEMKIEGDIIYFRYRCGEIFEPPTLKSGVDYEFLLRYFSIINFPVDIVESIINNIKKI